MIEFKNVTKRYGSVIAVNRLSFRAEAGKIYGFLGPNGAGKSTTMNMMTGCLASTEGEIRIGGCDIYAQAKEAKAKIGYLPEIPPLYTDMTPAEFLRFVGSAKGVKGEELQNQIQSAMAETGIVHVQNRLIGNLSKGYRQRVGIAMALMGNPEIVILDEPTVGLDPRQIREIRELIRELGKRHTVFLSSHILPEISAVCDHVMILSHGKLVANASMESLRAGLSTSRTTEVIYRGEENPVKMELNDMEGITSYTVAPGDEEGTVCLEITHGEVFDRDALSEVFYRLHYPVYRLESHTETLEDVFLKLTEEDGNVRNGLTWLEDLTEQEQEEEASEPAEETGYTSLFSQQKGGDNQ